MNNVELRHKNLAIIKEIQALCGWQSPKIDVAKFLFLTCSLQDITTQ